METITTVSERRHATPRIPNRSKEEIAEIAHKAVEGIEFVEMNDGNRLAYHLYVYLMGEAPSVAVAIYEAKARTPMPHDELERVIVERLGAAGVSEG